MKIKQIERILKEIREREDYLVNLRSKGELDVCSHCSGAILGGGYIQLFTLNEEEREYLKVSCIAEIKRLKKSIECLTD